MNGHEFFRTAMGRRFFEATLPQILDELKQLNATLASIAEALQALTRATRPPM